MTFVLCTTAFAEQSIACSLPLQGVDDNKPYLAVLVDETDCIWHLKRQAKTLVQALKWKHESENPE